MINFFNNSDKFILCGASEVGLYELKQKEHETDFIYDSPRLQNISETKNKFLIRQTFLRISRSRQSKVHKPVGRLNNRLLDIRKTLPVPDKVCGAVSS